MGVDADHQRRAAARLRHIYWVGGGSGAGKSTVARHIAARYGLRMYSTDDAMADHVQGGGARLVITRILVASCPARVCSNFRQRCCEELCECGCSQEGGAGPRR
ncbi:hypothetical protein GCM10027089_53310 [Nocardia thraciensis]